MQPMKKKLNFDLPQILALPFLKMTCFFCVMVVTGAYQANGKVAEAQNALEEAKTQMKELSEEYSDYEHYPNLKGYYTTTNSFFDFCLNPTGSFEQVKTTINDYRNEARDYMNDLDYIFEE